MPYHLDDELANPLAHASCRAYSCKLKGELKQRTERPAAMQLLWEGARSVFFGFQQERPGQLLYLGHRVKQWTTTFDGATYSHVFLKCRNTHDAQPGDPAMVIIFATSWPSPHAELTYLDHSCRKWGSKAAHLRCNQAHRTGSCVGKSCHL